MWWYFRGTSLTPAICCCRNTRVLDSIHAHSKKISRKKDSSQPKTLTPEKISAQEGSSPRDRNGAQSQPHHSQEALSHRTRIQPSPSFGARPWFRGTIR